MHLLASSFHAQINSEKELAGLTPSQPLFYWPYGTGSRMF